MDKGPLEQHLLDLLAFQTNEKDWEQVTFITKLLVLLDTLKDEGFSDIELVGKEGVKIHTDATSAFLGMKKVFQLYTLFTSNPYKVITEHDIIQHVWNGESKSQSNLSQTIKRLRKIIQENDQITHGRIEVIYGQGYRFVPEE